MREQLYYTYHNMKQRCLNQNRYDWKYYGGRGISICQRWLTSFKNFKEDMYPTYFENASLDRIDVNGNYSKENCRWIIFEEQARNKRVYINANAEVSGVSKHRNKWRARFYWKNKTYSLGVYDTKEEAVLAIENFSKIIKGENYARTQNEYIHNL